MQDSGFVLRRCFGSLSSNVVSKLSKEIEGVLQHTSRNVIDTGVSSRNAQGDLSE